MLWVRKGFIHLLSLVLLASLLGGALAVSADMALTHPAKIEAWLSQSNLYGHFVSNAIGQAQKSVSGSDQPGSVSLNDVAVQQAAQSAFPPQLLQQDVNTFLDSNYAWLQGKTATPNFTIDLTQAKQSFAQQVGKYVQTYSAGLPVCTTAQLIQLQNQNVDPLSATCRPATVSPAALGIQATQQLSTSGSFLSNPVITASTFHPKDKGQSEPYYQKLSHLPKAYRLAARLPLILGGIGIVSVLGIVFIAPRKRKGLRRVGIVLFVSGLVLVAMKFAADFAFKKAETRVFNNSSVGQLQQSLTDFAHRVESALVKTDLLFGIAFLLLAVIIFGILLKTRHTGNQMKNFGAVPPIETPPAAPAHTPSAPETAPTPPAGPQPPRPKRPRLIQ
jgi:hypothetical protein